MSSLTAGSTARHGIAASREVCDVCPGCRLPLPIRAKRQGEVAAHWECAACRAPLTGVLIQDEAARMADAIRIGQVHFDSAEIPPIPASLRQLVREFVTGHQESHEPDRRSAGPRMPVQVDVSIVPLDENWTPRCKPQLGLVVNLTAKGLGMLTTAPIADRHLGLQLRHPAGIVQVLGEVLWTNEIGMGFHNCGVQFLLRLGRSPRANPSS
jgi:hypothetical protein